MRFLTLAELIDLHNRIIDQTGGAPGLRDMGRLESAVAQPRMSFGGRDLYPTVIEKAAVLCFALIRNYPFVDGNKRSGHAAMEVFLVLNGHEINAKVDEQESIILGVASGQVSRQELTDWLTDQVLKIG